MFSTSQTRLFNPLLDNPLHGGSGGSESSSEGSRVLVHNVSPQQTSKSILRSPDTSPSNHNTAVINNSNTAMADKDHNTSVPTPMKLIPAFLLVPLEQVEQPGVVPVIPFVSGLPPPFSSPPRSNLEDITRANLTPLMLSKGIITSPAAGIPPVLPQSQNLVSSHPQYTQQSPLLFPNTFPGVSNTSFPNSQIIIKAVWPPIVLDIGPNDSSSGIEHIPPEGECVINNDRSDAASASENHTDTENASSISVPHSVLAQPQHKQVGHGHNPFAGPQKKSPARRHFSPYNYQQLNLPHQDPVKPMGKRKLKNATLRVIEWKNSLSRLWYLLEHNNYNEEEHHNLLSLLSKMNENQNHSNVTLELLKKIKVTEYLEKFKKEESIYNYDPSVRKLAGSILQFWSKK